MYIFLIVLIILASVLLVLAVLAQNPKGGMAANFGASNQVMGVRQTTDFLEKSTWTLAIAIVVLSLLASIAMSSHSNRTNGNDDAILDHISTEQEIVMPNIVTTPAELPANDDVVDSAADAADAPAAEEIAE